MNRMIGIAEHNWSDRQLEEIFTLMKWPLQLQPILYQQTYHLPQIFTPEQLPVLRKFIDKLNAECLTLLKIRLDALKKRHNLPE